MTITEPIPNLPLLRKVLDHIDAHPNEWHQSWWEFTWTTHWKMAYDLPDICGTTRCVAGWVQYMETGAVTDNAPDHARVSLGLTQSEAEALFWDTAESEDRGAQRAAIQYVAEGIAARAGEVL